MTQRRKNARQGAQRADDQQRVRAAEVDVTALLGAAAKDLGSSPEIVMQLAMEFARASERVGTSAAANLSWLHGFSQRDLSDGRELERARLEVQCFCSDVDRLNALGLDLNAWRRTPAAFKNEDVVVLQHEVRACLSQLALGKPYRLPATAIEAVQRDPVRERVSLTPAAEPRSVFWAAAASLLFSLPMLRFCRRPACGRPFVPSRRTQIQCSPVCSSRERQAAYRRRHPGQGADARRARYENSVRRTLPEGLEETLGGVPVKRRRRP